MVDDEPRNQKVTLSTETINAINEISGDGSSYDTVIQDLCKKEKANKPQAAKAQAQEKKKE